MKLTSDLTIEKPNRSILMGKNKIKIITAILLLVLCMLSGCKVNNCQDTKSDWISAMKTIDTVVCAKEWMDGNEHVTINYCYLPTKEGHLVYKTIFCAPAFEGYLIYEHEGNLSYIQVAWDRTQAKYIKERELFVGCESDMENTWIWECGLQDGKVTELRKTSIDISEYEGDNYLEKAIWCENLEELKD